LKNIPHVSAYLTALEEGKFHEALGFIWEKIGKLDKFINDEQPWTLAKSDQEKLAKVLEACVIDIQQIAILLKPFLPETAEKIEKQFTGPKIVSAESLFPRLTTA